MAATLWLWHLLAMVNTWFAFLTSLLSLLVGSMVGGLFNGFWQNEFAQDKPLASLKTKTKKLFRQTDTDPKLMEELADEIDEFAQWKDIARNG
jgi:hypothetical protein